MKKFLAGLIAGTFLSITLYFFINPGNSINIHTGEMLDRDTLFLKDGSIIKGLIRNQDGDDILIESDNGLFTIPRSECHTIHENALLLYVRELI